MENVEYQVVSGKRKVLVHGAGFRTRQEAVDGMIKLQLLGRRGLRVIKMVPVPGNMRKVVELRKTG